MNTTENQVEPTVSPVMASIVAQLAMPEAYARILADAELSCRQQCKLSVYRIEK